MGLLQAPPPTHTSTYGHRHRRYLTYKCHIPSRRQKLLNLLQAEQHQYTQVVGVVGVYAVGDVAECWDVLGDRMAPTAQVRGERDEEG